MDSNLIKIKLKTEEREFEHILEKDDLNEVFDSLFTGLKVIGYTNEQIKEAVKFRFLHLLVNN